MAQMQEVLQTLKQGEIFTSQLDFIRVVAV
jgi:hypothetical protein